VYKCCGGRAGRTFLWGTLVVISCVTNQLGLALIPYFLSTNPALLAVLRPQSDTILLTVPLMGMSMTAIILPIRLLTHFVYYEFGRAIRFQNTNTRSRTNRVFGLVEAPAIQRLFGAFALFRPTTVVDIGMGLSSVSRLRAYSLISVGVAVSCAFFAVAALGLSPHIKVIVNWILEMSIPVTTALAILACAVLVTTILRLSGFRSALRNTEPVE
jgi:hypothetical protein